MLHILSTGKSELTSVPNSGGLPQIPSEHLLLVGRTEVDLVTLQLPSASGLPIDAKATLPVTGESAIRFEHDCDIASKAVTTVVGAG